MNILKKQLKQIMHKLDIDCKYLALINSFNCSEYFKNNKSINLDDQEIKKAFIYAGINEMQIDLIKKEINKK